MSTNEKPKPDLKVGDVVQLTSGGPKMTVEIAGASRSGCVWFDPQQQLQRGEFKNELLFVTKA